jgi:Domain of unknown function (DUF2382)
VIAPESDVPDRPFPGAHSQVPGARTTSAETSTSVPAQRRLLPLEAVTDRSDKGWVVRLRVRAEHVTVSKELVVTERVVLRRGVVDDVVRLDAVVQREMLRLDTEGPVQIAHSALEDLSEPDGVVADQVPKHPEQLAARQGLPWRRDTSGPAADQGPDFSRTAPQ